MKIGFVCSEYPPGPHGGIGTMTQVLARALVLEGHEVRVIGVYDRSYPSPDFQEDMGVQIWRLREPGGPLGWVRARHRLFKTIAGWSSSCVIDLIEVPDWDGWAAHWPRLSVPVIVRLNGTSTYFASELGKPRRRFWSHVEESSFRRADFWCASSNYTARKTRNLFHVTSEPGAILYNPVELPALGGTAGRTNTMVVFTGTLSPKKGIVSLIRAWPAVVRARPDARLHVLGKEGPGPDGGSMTEFLRSQLDVQTLATVHFHGHVDRSTLLGFLKQTRVGVFPSYSETFGIAPVESMACGAPTVYTRRSCGPEVVRDRIDGLLVDPDDVEGISSVIIRLLSDDALATRLGEAGRQRVETVFSIERQLPQNVEFYRQCIEQFRMPHGRT